MKMNFTLRTALGSLVACAAMSVPPPAQASLTATQTLNFGFGPIVTHDGGGLQLKSAEETMLFKQFDPAMGSLIAARWELQSAFGAYAMGTVTSVDFDPDRRVTGGLTLGTSLNTYVGGANGLRGTSGDYFGATRSTSGNCTTTTAAGTCAIALELGDTLDGVIPVTLLDELIGTDDFLQGVQAIVALTHELGSLPIPTVSIDSLGQLIWADRADRNGIGQLRLVYEFEPVPAAVPEPASPALAGLGLALLLGLRLRRASQR